MPVKNTVIFLMNYRCRDGWILGVRTGLSTFNPNFSEAEVTIDVRIHIYRLNDYQCLCTPGVH
jgi:hypothetical protein